jgi:hypothetical protein
MLQRVEAEIRLPRCVGMAVDGNDAALFVQLVSAACTANCRCAAFAFELLGGIVDARNTLEQQPAHAVTSP